MKISPQVNYRLQKFNDWAYSDSVKNRLEKDGKRMFKCWPFRGIEWVVNNVLARSFTDETKTQIVYKILLKPYAGFAFKPEWVPEFNLNCAPR